MVATLHDDDPSSVGIVLCDLDGVLTSSPKVHPDHYQHLAKALLQGGNPKLTSTASLPEFVKKNVSNSLLGMTGINFSMSWS